MKKILRFFGKIIILWLLKRVMSCGEVMYQSHYSYFPYQRSILDHKQVNIPPLSLQCGVYLIINRWISPPFLTMRSILDYKQVNIPPFLTMRSILDHKQVNISPPFLTIRSILDHKQNQVNISPLPYNSE